MADRGQVGTEIDPKDTEELLYMDLNEGGSGFLLDSPLCKLDHCDLLLDAIDAQLGQLQVQTKECQVISKELVCIKTAPLRWSRSLSGDTGLGSTTQTNDTPMSCIDLMATPAMMRKAERSLGSEDLITPEESDQKTDKRRRDEEEMGSEREQIIWRLEKLLGETDNEGRMAGESYSPSDSIRTEDFVKCFRDEMVDLLPDTNMQQLHKEEQRAEMSDGDTHRNKQCNVNVNGGRAATPGDGNKNSETRLDSQPKDPNPREELEKCSSDCCRGNASRRDRQMLEETREELHRVTEEGRLLRSRCARLEEKQWKNKDQIKAAMHQVGELQGELGECRVRVGALEQMLAQKELQLLDLKEDRAALQAEGDRLKGELQHLKSQHTDALQEAAEQAHRMTEEALKQQKKDLTLVHEQQIQKVSKAVEEERKKWKAEKVEAVKINCTIIEEQNGQVLESMRREVQSDKGEAMARRQNVVERKTLQKVESESCRLQRERESLLAVVYRLLKEEHQAELEKLQRQMEQESQRVVSSLQQGVKRAEKEADRLRVLLEEKENGYNRLAAEMELQVQRWATELGAECQHLHLLVEQNIPTTSPVELPPSSTVGEVLTTLSTLREQLKKAVSFLHQELDSQKQTTERLRNDKERELKIQRQQLRTERDQALDSLKERLVLEHIEELSRLSWARVCDGGVAASLHKQLKAEDQELRQVQQNMVRWKQQTAARPARKCEEEVSTELERGASNTQEGRRTKHDGPAGTMVLSSKQESQNPLCSPSVQTLPSDVASLKLLHYLQSRVKQLRVENQAHIWSPSPRKAS